MHEFGSGSKGLNAAAIAVIGAVCALPLMLAAAAVADSVGEGKSGIILYVDDDAPGGPNGGDGLSWKSPLRYLQDALAIANAPNSGVTEIRLGQGVYKPDQGANQTPGDVNATFSIPSGLALRGGYAGFGAANPDERDWTEFESILSGDLLGNDPVPTTWPPPASSAYIDNSFTIVKLVNAVSVIIEGLTITASRPNNSPINHGGGIHCEASDSLITHCFFRHNGAYYGGGIAVVLSSNVTVHECTFHQNAAAFGGGLGEAASTGTIVEDCVFTGNRTLTSFGKGAGAAMSGGTIRNCTFISNRALQAGQGGAISASSATLIEDCHFELNNADLGGAVVGRPLIDGCTFINNSAGWGGAISNDSSQTGGDCRNSTFQMNHAFAEGGAFQGRGTFVNCTFQSNSVGWGGGGAGRGSGTFMNCRFLGNQTGKQQGGGGILIDSTATLVNCLFSGNASTAGGGAIRVFPNQRATIINCTVGPNSSTQGANAIAADGVLTIANSIIWANGSIQMTGTPDVSYSCVQGGWVGAGNVALDPMFVNAAGEDGIPGNADDDLGLSAGSPCIDAGNNLALPFDIFDLDGDGNATELLPTDLAGNLRRVNDPGTLDSGNAGGYPAITDMGAIEFIDFKPVYADVTLDGWVGVEDLLAVINAWGPCEESAPCPADIDLNRVVNIQDLLAVLANWM